MVEKRKKGKGFVLREFNEWKMFAMRKDVWPV